MLFSCFSCSKSLCIVIWGTWTWNRGWNATRTVVYNLGIENRHQSSQSSGTPKLKCLVTKLFSMNTNFSSLVMRSNMDHWRSFRIKISHVDMYTRNHYIWRHLLCIYLFTNSMWTIMIFNVLQVMHLSAAIPGGWPQGNPGHLHQDIGKFHLPRANIRLQKATTVPPPESVIERTPKL